MEKNNVCIPSVSSVNGATTSHQAVVGAVTKKYVVRRISRPMRSDVRPIGSGEPIDWNKVYA